jgi:type IV pilus assembly protein PilM
MPRTVVGLDIGSSAVRAVELKVGSRSTSLRHCGEVPLPTGAVEAGSVRNAAVVTQAIRELWHGARIKNRDVRLGVGSGSVLVRQLELDWMPPADLRKALRYQVADLLPVSVDDANLDHVPLGEFEREDPELETPRRMVRILLVATARGAVDEMVRCVHAAGLRPTTADLSALALARASARAAALRKEDALTEAVIDIGADKVAVAVHTGGHPHFVRVVAGVGGSTLTRALADQTGRTREEAETLKQAVSLPLPTPALTATGDPLVDPGVGSFADSAGRHLSTDDTDSRIVLEAAHQLVGELRSTLDFHASTDPEHPPARVLLTGGGSALAGLPELCRRSLDLPVHRFEPQDVLPGLASRRGRKGGPEDPLATDASLLVPIGLALGAAS